MAFSFFMVSTVEPFTLGSYTVVEWDLVRNGGSHMICASILSIVLGVLGGVLIGHYLWKDGNEKRLIPNATTQISSLYFCSNYGKQLTDKLSYCPHCGNRLK